MNSSRAHHPRSPRGGHRTSPKSRRLHRDYRRDPENIGGWHDSGEAGAHEQPNRPNLSIEYVPITVPKPDPRNVRTHSSDQILQIAASIKTFGMVNPLLIDERDGIIAGHARRDAAEEVGYEMVPVIRLNHLSEHEKRALAIADNKLPENAGWDEELLAHELKILSEVDVDFDVTVTGFSQGEIDFRIESLSPTDDPAADELPDVEEEDAIVVRRGDQFQLGRHLLRCGNATSRGDMAALMSDHRAQMVVTDPPYNLQVEHHVSGLGRMKHSNFEQGSGEMSSGEFKAFLQQSFANLAAFSIDGSIHFVFMDWRHLEEIFGAGDAIYGEPKQMCVWVKTNAGMGSFYRSQHELVMVFKNGTAPHINNFELGQHGRWRSNVWSYPGLNSLGPDRMTELALHPTVKPVAMIADAILDCSTRREIILDPFVGSGTTIIAAEKVARRAYAMELDPKYVQTAIRRWESYTGKHARHASLDLSFDELCERRCESKLSADDSRA